MRDRKIKISWLIAHILVCHFASAQDNPLSIPLANLKTPNSPCFQLLDISPSSVEHPGNPKEFAVSALSQLNNGNGIPKNFAYEIAPYWFFKPQSENVYKYINVDASHSAAHYYTGILRKLAISIASTFSDSTSGSLLNNTNYISFGIRTNLITIRKNSNIDNIIQDIHNLHGIQGSCTVVGQTATELAQCERSHPNYKTDSAALQNDMNETPLFQLDAAAAYSEAYAANSFNNSRFNRSAEWITATFGESFWRNHRDKFYLMGMFKLLQDKILTDTAKSVFENKSAIDLGGKLSYSNGNFLIGVEFVQRTYAGDKAISSNRCVGIIQYKMNDNLYLTTSFGQNFGSTHNLFTLVGLNFGFGNKGLSLPD
ncbi:MAG TPA: hypothetical protein VKR53_03350 [Puia sp.]|nr:hypothetical protein [Puia sp.]